MSSYSFVNVNVNGTCKNVWLFSKKECMYSINRIEISVYSYIFSSATSAAYWYCLKIHYV